MLNKIIIINSELYAKAEIELGNASSIQLVGKNNIGKSSLINTLNFLYITEPSQMRFEGGRRFLESLPHYFPTLDQSYIIFEIKNSTYSCILVKRTKDNDIAYYRIPHAYEESFFFTTQEDAQKVLPFKEVKDQLALQKIDTELLPRNELYRTVYSTHKADQPVLLLSKTQKGNPSRRKKQLNTFTAIYKHLIRSAKTSADDLTSLLIEASSYASELNIFAGSSNTHLNDVEKLEKKARKLTEAQPTFERLKKANKDSHELQQSLGKAYYTFQKEYDPALQKLSEKINESEKKIQELEEETKKIATQKEQIFQEKGRYENIQKQHNQDLRYIDEKLKIIAPYETKLAFSALQKEVEQLESQKIRLKKALYDQNRQIKKPQQLKQELAQLKAKADQLTHTLVNFSDTLIQHISPDINVRKRLNTFLSKELLYLPKTAIQKQVSKITKELSLFDGKIDISGLTTDKPFTSLEEFQAQLTETKKEIQAIQALLDNQEALTHTEAQWQERYDLLRQVQEKPTLITQQKELQKVLQEAAKKEKQCEEQLKTYQKSQEANRKALGHAEEQKNTLKQTKEGHEVRKKELKERNIPIIEEQLPETNLDKLYQRILQEHEEARGQEVKTRKLMGEIQAILKEHYHQDIDQYIQTLTQEFDSIQEIYEKRDSILEGVIQNFVQPTQTFLNNYQEFKKYLQDFSRKLAGHHISGIEKLDLHLEESSKYLEELTEISRIKPTTPLGIRDVDQDKRMNLLRRYIAAEYAFHLKDLFRLKLRITKNDGKKQTLDISKQMQSYGTDKVLRIFIFVMLLKEFFIAKPDNRVAIYIDEVGTVDRENIQRILSLCAQHQILPIFASISPVEGLDKHYLLLRSDENNGKLCVNESTTLHTDLPATS